MARPARPLVPGMSPAHALGAELRRHRERAGLSQAALGEIVRCSGALLGKIEKAERCPSPELCELLDTALETSGTLTARRAEVAGGRRGEYLALVDPAWTLDSALRALRDLTEGHRVDRRDFLALTGAALTATAGAWSGGTARTGPLPGSPAGARGLGSVVLDRLATRLADIRALDDELGGTALTGLAGAELRWLHDLAAGDRLAAGECESVLGLVTEAARLNGWLQLDAGHHAAAQAHYVCALRCAAATGDVTGGANVLAGMSFQAMLVGRTIEALSLIDTAEQRVGRTASPKLRALLSSRRARAHARAGDARACGQALATAEAALDRVRGDDREPDWIYFFDDAELDAQAGACWVDLHDARRARPLLDKALQTMGPQYVRDRTICHVRSAQAHLSAGDLDPACGDLTAAVTLADRTRSTRCIDTIRHARAAMDHRRNEPMVREFDQLCADALGVSSSEK